MTALALAIGCGCGVWAQDRPAISGDAAQKGGKPATAVPQ
jgi:hypothetical protein